MTKVVKWWHKMSFWTKVKRLIGLCAAGGELTVLLTESVWWWHGVVVAATVVSFVIADFCQDLNNNGIIDICEDPPSGDKKEQDSD